LERYLIEKIRVPRSKITQIYNGVDCQRFQITLRRAPLAVPGFAGPDAFIFGTVGRFQPIKDQLTLVKAFIHLLNLAPDLCHRIRLVAVGDGPLRQQAIELLHAANASDYAWLPGERDDVPEILHALDVFVLPSLAEGISNTILEAMASGLPVIATQVGGNLELVVDGSTGRLVPAADPLALMQAMEGYLRNPQKAREHGRAGRCRVEDHFSIEQMVGQYLGVYDAVLRQKTEKGIARDRTRPSLHRH
jgi:sugar transferase (PEP-CTERM/EpsH1 system associated)